MVDVESLVGTTLGQYELRRLVGSGGMGAVYRGVQVNLQRDVAVKVLSNKLIANADYIARFNREALIAASLEHAHIVPIYDYGIQGEINYVVMRLLTGGSLDQRLGYVDQADRPLPSVRETLDVMRQIANALDYAHSQGVVHRDNKASNVMFDKHGDAFLVDFGIARMVESTSQLTGTGMTLGTPSYMSPEQWRGEEAVPQSDQYSVGVLAFALLTGQLPFSAPNPHSLLYMHLNDPPPSPQAIRPELGSQLDSVFERVMAKAPIDRYDTVSDFVDALEAAAPTADVSVGLHQNTGFFVTTLPEENQAEPTPASKALKQSTAKATPSSDMSQSDAQTEVIDSNRVMVTRQQRGRGWLLSMMAGVLLFIGVGAGISYMQLQQVPPGGLFVAAGLVNDSPTPVITATDTRQPTETLTVTPSTPVAVSVRDNLVLRMGPGDEYPVRTTLVVNETIDIVGISEDDEWYRVQTVGGAVGWVRISSSIMVGGNLQAVPVALAPTATPTETATPTQRAVSATDTPPVIVTLVVETATVDAQTRNCPGTLPTRLAVGNRGYVLDEDPRPVNVRRRPALIATRIGQIPVRSIFEVIDGPECRVGIAWFKVRYNGLEGWIAEGEGPSYFVRPARATDSQQPTSPPDDTLNSRAQVNAYVERFPACDNIIVDEDFNGPDVSTVWYEEDTPEFTIGIDDGRYALQMRDIMMPGDAEPVSWGSLQDTRFGDGRLDAVIMADKFRLQDSSRTGIWLRYQNEENFLAFMVNNRENYRIARFEDEYIDVEGGWEAATVINTGPGAVNWLSVDAEGYDFEFYINGEFITRVRDDRWADGRIAFFGSTLDQPARFSLEHLRICGR